MRKGGRAVSRGSHSGMVIVFLAEGFEEIEALTPVDILRRAGFAVKTAAVGSSKLVRGSHGIPVEADILAADVEEESPEAVILPGGMPGALNLDASPEVDAVLRAADRKGAVIGAICAAPLVLGRRGMLEGRRAACYPGFEKELKGAVTEGGRVEVDGRFVTACGMGAATEFSLALVDLMKGERAAKELGASILAK